MIPSEEVDGTGVLVAKCWGWHWLALFRFRIYLEVGGDYVEFWSLNLGPVSVPLPKVKLRQDCWYRRESLGNQ